MRGVSSSGRAMTPARQGRAHLPGGKLEALSGVPDEHAPVQGLGRQPAPRQEAQAVDGLPVLRPAVGRQLLQMCAALRATSRWQGRRAQDCLRHVACRPGSS